MMWLPGAGAAFPAPDTRLIAREQAARGDRLFAQAQFGAAVEEFRRAVALCANDPRYHYMLATCAARSNQPQFIEPHLREGLRLKPDAPVLHQELAQHLVAQGRIDEALQHSARALSLAPADPNYVIVHALVLEKADRDEESWGLAEPLIAAGNNHGALLALYGALSSKLGRDRESVAVFERALKSREVEASRDTCANVHFMLGQVLERLGQYDRAFTHFRTANEIGRTTRAAHDPDDHSHRVSNVIRYFTPRRLHSLPRAMHDDRRPVFIVGMPRSGTSLVEQIVASHPSVFGAGEIDLLSRLAMTRGTGSVRGPWDELTIGRADELAAQYLAHIASLKPGDATCVTDKMPENFLRLDAVEILFPGARIIHCVRDPLDTCFSCYATNFENGHAYAFDLAHLGAYYADYRRLMDHWKRVLSVPIFDVRYEDLVLAPEANVRRLLEFLELPWDERCLKFHENKRHVRTASREQVRRPIYTSSIGRWKNYQTLLDELIEQLAKSSNSRAAAAAA